VEGGVVESSIIVVVSPWDRIDGQILSEGGEERVGTVGDGDGDTSKSVDAV